MQSQRVIAPSTLPSTLSSTPPSTTQTSTPPPPFRVTQEDVLFEAIDVRTIGMNCSEGQANAPMGGALHDGEAFPHATPLTYDRIRFPTSLPFLQDY